MDLVNVTKELLPDGRIYTGTLLITEGARYPHGYGKMEYADYYVIGKYDKGILNSPAYVNHNYYMYFMRTYQLDGVLFRLVHLECIKILK